jgi:CheY-like chemotaxis protein
LVEDNVDLLNLTRESLAEWFRVLRASNGREALEVLAKENVDVIVSDVMMPKISGFDMLDILRSTTETKNIKVIMMTALSSEDQRQRGVALGADRNSQSLHTHQ